MLGVLAGSAGWLEDSITGGNIWAWDVERQLAGDRSLRDVFYHDGDNSGVRVVVSYSNDLQCVERTRELRRSWKTSFTVNRQGASARVDATFELVLATHDPVLDCLRSLNFVSDKEFVRNHFGLIAVRSSEEATMEPSAIAIAVDSSTKMARVTAVSSATVPLGAVTVKMRKATNEWRNALELGEVSIRTEQMKITRVDGATVRSQDHTTATYSFVHAQSPIVFSVSPDGLPAPDVPYVPSSKKANDPKTLLLFPLLALFPWTSFLVLSRKEYSPQRHTVRHLFGWLVLSVFVAGGLTTVINLGVKSLIFVIIFVAVPTALVLAFHRTELTPRKFSATLTTVVALGTMAYVGLDQFDHPGTYGRVMIAFGTGLLASIFIPSFRSWRHSLLFGAICLTSVIFLHHIDFPQGFLAPVGLIPWAIAVYVGLRRWGSGRAVATAGLFATLACMSPIHLLLYNWRILDLHAIAFTANFSTSELYIAEHMLVASGYVLLAYLARLLWRARDDADTVGTALPRAAGIALLLPVWISWAPVSVDVLRLMLFIALMAWLIRNGPNAKRLALVSPLAHARLLRLDTYRRSMQEYATAHHRAARSKVAGHDVTPQEAMAAQRTLDVGAGHFRHLDGHKVGLTQAAQGSAAGRSLTHNARFGALIAAVISLPSVVYEMWPAVTATMSNLYMFKEWSPLILVLWGSYCLRWIVLGAIFGYFYPAVRGATPLTKAMALLLVVLPAEILAIDFSAPMRALALAVGIKAGFTLVFCLCLGLAWEWWLTRAANVRWGRIRDFTRLKSFLVPVSTVVIAGVTALATGFAGAAVTGVLQQPSQLPGQSVNQVQPPK
ncbi:hypothetical protein [Lentzea sp. HUAS12]|uniref:hypothetical protein n=1 Tax=Lentzea sp. HUAS12 TaxID=2951806 RepID=UPI00209D3C77|nr:hypothetical protein [Lentzea sp. HUAS12]USX56100.1 hypothetical protein ND450_18985 [Lentzea sp. HUAS12]